MKKIAEKILFLIFMSKIINSFPYASALAKSMNHNKWKYEPQHGTQSSFYVKNHAVEN